MKFVYFFSAMHPTSVEYGPQSWLVPAQEFRALDLDLQHIYDEYGVETWLEQSNEIREMAIDMKNICDHFRHTT